MDPTAFLGLLSGYMIFLLARTLRPKLQPVLLRVLRRK
jgi:hypothetical protein